MRYIFIFACLLAITSQVVRSKHFTTINYDCLNAIDNGVSIVKKFIADYQAMDDPDEIVNDLEAFYINKENIIEYCPNNLGIKNYEDSAADANCRRLIAKLVNIVELNSLDRDRFQEHIKIINGSFDIMPSMMINCVPR